MSTNVSTNTPTSKLMMLSLNRYFTDLEVLFKKHVILKVRVDDWKVLKELAVRYVPNLIEDAWKSLSMFADTTATYDEFQDEVYSLYPGVKRTHKFTMINIHCLVAEQQVDKLINDINDYSLLYVHALPMLKSLLAKSRVTFLQVNGFLAEVLDPTLKSAITLCLEHAFPNCDPDTPYTLDQFHAVVTYILQHCNDDANTIFCMASNLTHVPAPVARTPELCYDWLSSKIREAYEDEQGYRQALVQRERSKAQQSGW
ncbi:hypothetical protein V8D89_007841 [Ganoderma adspersum]